MFWKFQNCPHNHFTHFNVSLTMSFDLFLLDVQISVSSDPSLEWHHNEGLGMGLNIVILKRLSQKWIANLQKNIFIEFDLFITGWI